MEQKYHGINLGSLLLGILLLIISLIAFKDLTGNLLSNVIVFAIFAIVKGSIEICNRSRIQNLAGFKAYASVIIGIIDIIIGFYLLFNLNLGLISLPFILAIWFLLNSFFELLQLDFSSAISTEFFWFSLILNVLGIILGIELLVVPITPVFTLNFLVGVYFLLFGIRNIVYAFI